MTVQEASEAIPATLPATLTMAAEQVEAVQPAGGAEVEEVVAEKGYHSDATLVALDEIGVAVTSQSRSGSALLAGQEDGETPAEKRAAQRHYMGTVGVFAATEVGVFNAAAGARGAAFRAPVRDRGAAAGVGARPRECAQAGAHPGGRLQPRTAAAPADRRRHAPSLQGRALSAICGLIGRLTALWGRLTASWTSNGRRRGWSAQSLIASCLNRPAQRTAFFHGLLRRSRNSGNSKRVVGIDGGGNQCLENSAVAV